MNKEDIDQKPCLPNQPWRLVFEALSDKMEEEEYFADTENQEYEADELADVTETEFNCKPEILSKNTDLEIYPNPANSEVYIRIPNTQGERFTLVLTDIQMKAIKVLESGSIQNQHIYKLQDVLQTCILYSLFLHFIK